MKVRNEIGKRFGRLTVLHSYVGTGSKCLCMCDCGELAIKLLANVKNGRTQSCGCYVRETIGNRQRTHGESKKSKEYRTWASIRERCFCKTNPAYKNYGGRGVTMCEGWAKSFESFLHDMGRAPSPSLSIDRIDVNGHYEPSNCRWATDTEQANNTTRNVYLEHDGVRLTLKQWSEKIGIDYKFFYDLVRYNGLTIADIINRIEIGKIHKQID